LTTDDALYEKVAKKVLLETLHMKKGETLTIETWNSGLGFARTLVVEARRMGVIPIVTFEDESAYVEGVKVAPKDIVGTMGKHEYGLLAGSDAYVFIPGSPLTAYPPRLSRDEVADSTRYNNSWYEAAERAKLRGARLAFGYISKEYARLYGKKPEELVRNQLRAAALADFQLISATGKAIGEALTDGARASISSSGSNKIEFVLKGDLTVEDGVVGEGDLASGENMTYVPPGYVFKAVDSTTVNGSVAVSSSVTRLGLLKEARLDFEEGRLVGWKSEGSAKMLKALVEAVDPEKRVIYSLTVGLNPAMKYESGQDRLVSGAIGIGGGFGFQATVRRGTLSVSGNTLVEKGKLAG
jgi:leucyl aminopeptidase (aminopeptidase T)